MTVPRPFAITDINHPDFTLKKELTGTQERDETGYIARVEEADIEGKGEAWSTALQDLHDNLVGAVDSKQPLMMSLVKERGKQPEPVVVSEPISQYQPPLRLPDSTVYVLVNPSGEVEAVVSDIKWARRFKKWQPGANFIQCQVDDFRDNDDAQG